MSDTLQVDESNTTSEVTMSDAEIATGPTINASPCDKLLQECIGFQFNMTGLWPQGNRAWTKERKSAVAAEYGYEDQSAFSASDKLYDSKCKPVADANELRNRIRKFIASQVIPLADASNGSKKLPGVYLLRRSAVAYIEQQLKEFRVETDAQAQRLTDAREEILDASRQKLKDNFCESNYPTEWVLGFKWGFPNVEPPSYLAKLAPEAYARQVAEVRGQMEDTAKLATADFLSELGNVVGSWAEKFKPFIRIHPDRNHPLSAFGNCRVVSRFTNTEDLEIPAGHCRVIIRVPKVGQVESHDKDLGVMTMADYRLLNVQKDESQRPISTNLVENMLAVFDRFKNVGGQLFLDENELKHIDEVNQHLRDALSSQGSRGAKGVAAKLKQDSFREQTRKLLLPLASTLSTGIAVRSTTSRKMIV